MDQATEYWIMVVGGWIIMEALIGLAVQAKMQKLAYKRSKRMIRMMTGLRWRNRRSQFDGMF